jgi:hypothetical protein
MTAPEKPNPPPIPVQTKYVRRWVGQLFGVLLLVLTVAIWAVLTLPDTSYYRLSLEACASVRWCRPFYVAAWMIAFGAAGFGAWWLAFRRHNTSGGRNGA